jgi:CRISPR system Cascade subunit CasD
MDDFLVFTLSAQVASMGDQPGNQFRGSLHWPGKSAILGMIAAARGIDREDTEGQNDVCRHNVAVGIHNAGDLFTDFHTVQTVPGHLVKHPVTRPDALKLVGEKVTTSITRRQYRSGVLFSIAVWGGDLEAACTALQRPATPLFLGRKSCTLSAPPAPRIVQSDGPVSALRHAFLPDERTDPLLEVASDPHPLVSGRIIHRNDDPQCRIKWHFRSRAVTVMPILEEG